MNQKPKVNYPKTKLKFKRSQLNLKEPVRKSMYDRVVENLKIAGRKTFLHRIVYGGIHTFDAQEKVTEFFHNTVVEGNKTSICLEEVTGILLFYDKYYIHFIEGDEDAINGHVKIFLNDPLYKQYIKKSKLLIHSPHIHKRLAPVWKYYYGKPPKLHKNLSTYLDYDTISRLTLDCFEKIHDFVCKFYADKDSKMALSLPTDSMYQDEDEVLSPPTSLDPYKLAAPTPSAFRLSTLPSFVRSLKLMKDYKYRRLLPEVEILDLVMRDDGPIDLITYSSKYMDVKPIEIYKDKVWPIASDFIPYDIFTGPYNPIIDFSGHEKYLPRPSWIETMMSHEIIKSLQAITPVSAENVQDKIKN